MPGSPITGYIWTGTSKKSGRVNRFIDIILKSQIQHHSRAGLQVE